MQCPLCRTLIPDSSAQCPVCRAQFGAPARLPYVASPSARDLDSHGDAQKRSTRGVSLGIGAAIALLVVVVSAAILLGRASRANAVVPLGSRERLVKIGDQWRYTFEADVDWMG